MRSRVLAGAALVVCACGGGTGSSDVAGELRSQFRNSEGITADKVRCEGGGEFAQGDRTTCSLTVGSVTIDYDVVFVTDNQFDATPKATLIKKGDLEKRLAEQQLATTRLEVTVDCGPQPIYDTVALTGAACTAVTPTGTYPIRITVDGSNFSSVPAKPLVFKAEIEPFVSSHLVTLGVSGATVDCGPHPVLAVDAGTTLPCQSTAIDGTVRTTTVSVDEAGKLTILATS